MKKRSIRSVVSPILCSLVVGFTMVVGGAQLEETKAGEVGIVQEQPLGSASYLAYGMCRAWEKKSVANSCEVDTWTSRIKVTLDTTAPEALKTCRDVRDTVARKTNAFDGRGWRLRIEDDHGMLLAECGLL